MKFSTLDFNKMYNGSWFTIEGAGGDLKEWVEGLTDMMSNEEGIGTPQEWMTWKGSEMNNHYDLTGNNRYPEDFTFLACSLEGLDPGKLAAFKMRFGARWFDDIVDNNARRERGE